MGEANSHQAPSCLGEKVDGKGVGVGQAGWKRGEARTGPAFP